MTAKTLYLMSKGGVHDHLGGGFHRYSVDKFWIVPHFEKMLYDQAQLAYSFIETYQITKDKFFADIAEDILGYVSNKLTNKSTGASTPLSTGGFYSAEDAESAIHSSHPNEKEEGAFYVWEQQEIEKLLGEDRARVFNFYFGTGERGNAPAGSDPHNVFENKNILYEANTLSATANKFELSTDKVYEILQESKKILYEAREKRPLPHLDDKILTSWNGLMISAFAKAYQVMHKTEYLERAVESVEFILGNLYDKENKVLLHRYRDGEAKIEGGLQDYAFFIQALIDLYESTFEMRYLESAVELNNIAMDNFYDKKDGGFWDTSGKDESILLRTKEDYDSAEPTGNSIAIMNMLRLSQFTNMKELYAKAYKSLQLFGNNLSGQPYALPQMLCALDYILQKPKQIIVAGKKDDPDTLDMLNEIYEHYIPNKILIQYEPGAESKVIPFLSSIIPASINKTAVYICENYTCQLPVKSIEELRTVLSSKEEVSK